MYSFFRVFYFLTSCCGRYVIGSVCLRMGVKTIGLEPVADFRIKNLLIDGLKFVMNDT